MTTDWEPEKYEDQYQTALMARIEHKIQNKPLSSPAEPAQSKMVGAILSILQKSIQTTTEKKGKSVRFSQIVEKSGHPDLAIERSFRGRSVESAATVPQRPPETPTSKFDRYAVLIGGAEVVTRLIFGPFEH